MEETSGLMFAKIIASLGLLICIALAVQMMLRPNQQRWVDARLRRAAWRLRDGWAALSGWRRRSELKKQAAAEAEAAIERARSKTEGEWDGNVYRPKQFDKPPRKLH